MGCCAHCSRYISRSPGNARRSGIFDCGREYGYTMSPGPGATCERKPRIHCQVVGPWLTVTTNWATLLIRHFAHKFEQLLELVISVKLNAADHFA